MNKLDEVITDKQLLNPVKNCILKYESKIREQKTNQFIKNKMTKILYRTRNKSVPA